MNIFTWQMRYINIKLLSNGLSCDTVEFFDTCTFYFTCRRVQNAVLALASQNLVNCILRNVIRHWTFLLNKFIKKIWLHHLYSFFSYSIYISWNLFEENDGLSGYTYIFVYIIFCYFCGVRSEECKNENKKIVHLPR